MDTQFQLSCPSKPPGLIVVAFAHTALEQMCSCLFSFTWQAVLTQFE